MMGRPMLYCYLNGEYAIRLSYSIDYWVEDSFGLVTVESHYSFASTTDTTLLLLPQSTTRYTSPIRHLPRGQGAMSLYTRVVRPS